MSHAHATYFGQSQPRTLPEGDGETARLRNEHTETTPTFTTVRQTEPQRESEPEQREREPDYEFRRDLVTRIDKIIQDFREQKVAKIEALYQILRVAQQAEVDEHIRQTAIDDYATQIDLIDAQRRTAEQRGEHAAQLVRINDEPTATREPVRDEHRRREARQGGSEDDEAGRFIRDLRRQLTRKRRHRSPTDSSDSDDDSTSAKGEGESNKKKRLYQSQLP